MVGERKSDEGISPRLAEALASNDLAKLREVLLTLDAREQEQLAQHIGAPAVDALMRTVRRSRSSDKRGRVVVINGIMGAKLDVVDRRGKRDAVWVDYWSLFRGHIEDLELDLQGREKNAGNSVRVAGLFPEYLPLVAELDRHWHVLQFPFDWRQDIDLSARRLAEEIQRWSLGEPVHIVAHSMGGLVARRFCAKFPEVWAAMKDPDGRGRGGRLAMLGTPNQGSFAIPMVFCGAEPIVGKLALLDVHHDQDELLSIFATFPGCYQMLPSPERTFSDDRLKLFARESWGKLAVHAQHLELGRAFQRDLSRVIDPERLVYVAGYGRATPYRVHIERPGKFRFLTTLNGDGRVPHELGLFEEVRTLWVDELHGDLAKNDAVLEGIHELLSVGTTGALESNRPAPKRALTETAVRAGDEHLADERERERLDEFEELAKRAQRRGATKLSERDEARIASLLSSEFTGTADAAATKPEEQGAERARARTAIPKLHIEVVWGDITRVDGDVYAAGHYEGVLPQNAEYALDMIVSPPNPGEHEMVLREHTRRGVLCGELGKVAFYPWFDRAKRRSVAIAGMGYQGTFGRNELRKLAHNLGIATATLPRVRTLCSVLIGSGFGNLSIRDAVANLVWGLADALAKPDVRTSITKLRIVELRREEARKIHEQLVELAVDAKLLERLRITVEPEVVPDASAQLSEGELCSQALATVLRATLLAGTAVQRRARGAALRKLGGKALDAASLTRIAKKLEKAGSTKTLDELARALKVDISGPGRPKQGQNYSDEAPTRLACVDDESALRVSLLTKTAVIPERAIRVDGALIDELVERMTDPEYGGVSQLGALLGKLVLPRDFRDNVRSAESLVVEVDRRTARIHWEMLSVAASAENPGTPLALQASLSRQLRTAYSPAPTIEPPAGRKLRMLLVGDPGDPRAREDLPGARREALAIYAAFKDRDDVDIDVLIGAPSVARKGELRGIAPAARLDVLDHLMRGGYDVLHYCGHGDFDAEDPTRSGWVFQGGLLTARELERIDLAPRLVVANACLSGLTSNRRADGAKRDEAGLLPSLADEFFHRGVRNYVGTAWEVSDEGAIAFATRLYAELIPAGGMTGAPIGAALRSARELLKREETAYEALWAAYQHYGDPTFQLVRS